MSRLRTALERYVSMRQGLGYKYRGRSRRLPDFVAFIEARGADTITTVLAMEWVTLIGRQPSWSIRLTDVRCFAQHLAHFDPLTEVPLATPCLRCGGRSPTSIPMPRLRRFWRQHCRCRPPTPCVGHIIACSD